MFILRSVAVGMLLAYFTQCLKPALADDINEPIKLGLIVSLTGPAAEQGRNWLAGAELAAREYKRSGKLVDLIIEDDGTNPAKVTSAFRKLASIDRVSGIVGGTWDFLFEAAAPLASQYKIPFFSPTNPVEILSRSAQSNPWIYTNGLRMEATASAIEKIWKRLKPKSAALIFPNVPFGVAHATIIEKLAHEQDLVLALNQPFEYAGYIDVLRNLALKLSILKPEMVFCLTDYAALDAFMTELERHKYYPWVITTQHLDEAVQLSSDPKKYQKVIGIYPASRSEKFAQQFRADNGSEPKVYAAEGYESLRFLVEAIESEVDLSKTAFEASGLTGTIKSSPQSRNISQVKAVALKVNPSGTLAPF